MAAPHRGNTGYSCYFVTASTFQKQNLLQSDRMAKMFIDVLLHYRKQGRFLLHEFVVMPNHFHLLITPTDTLERALQLIKGGFSYRARKELRFTGELWQPSYYDRQVRNIDEYMAFRGYILMNAVKAKLAAAPEEFPYCSAHPGFDLDGLPQRLKPIELRA